MEIHSCASQWESRSCGSCSAHSVSIYTTRLLILRDKFWGRKASRSENVSCTPAEISTAANFLHNLQCLLHTISSAYANHMARPDCPKCGGTGWKIIEGDRELSPAVARVPELAARQAAAAGASVISIDAKHVGASAGQPRVAVLCDCVEVERAVRGLGRARIPSRYEHCDFESFESGVYEGTPEASAFNRNLTQAKLVAEAFARDYPLTMDAGLLFVGPCGAGKTHLAVAVAKQ